MELLEPHVEPAHGERPAQTLFVPGLREQIERLRRAYPELTLEAVGRILRLPRRMIPRDETAWESKS